LATRAVNLRLQIARGSLRRTTPRAQSATLGTEWRAPTRAFQTQVRRRLTKNNNGSVCGGRATRSSSSVMRRHRSVMRYPFVLTHSFDRLNRERRCVGLSTRRHTATNTRRPTHSGTVRQGAPGANWRRLVVVSPSQQQQQQQQYDRLTTKCTPFCVARHAKNRLSWSADETCRAAPQSRCRLDRSYRRIGYA
jgi:hypothetical protein